MDVKGHVTVIGALHIGLGVLGLLLAPVLISGSLDLPMLRKLASMHFLGLQSRPLGYAIGLIAVLGVILGTGLVKRWHWVRGVSLALAYSDLLMFPVGTLLGMYTIWTLRQVAAVRLFAERPDQ